MSLRFHNIYHNVRELLSFLSKAGARFDAMQIAQGTLLARSIIDRKDYSGLASLEFKVFSQFGDDGIIQYLTQHLELKNKTFIEFGVGDYFESNTRFLLQKDNWSGFVMDGSAKNINRLKAAPFFWRHDLCAEAAHITRENILELLSPHIERWGSEPDLLHIDLDGNDYWIWKDLTFRPAIVILEYNGTFGIDRAVTVPYDPNFYRTSAHHSNLYWGASLKALHDLSREKGYAFIGCNSAGNNAYFIRQDMMNDRLHPVTLSGGYVAPKYRESRNHTGELTYLSSSERRSLISGMPLINTETGKLESL